MTRHRPEFHLSRVFADGTREGPQIVPVTTMPWSTSMGRRGALGSAMGMAGVLTLLEACNRPEPTRPYLSDDSGATCLGTPAPRLIAHRGGLTALMITPSGKLLVSGGHDSVKLWSLPEGKLLATLRGHYIWVSQLVITRDETLLISGESNHTSDKAEVSIKVWSLPAGKLVTALRGHQGAIHALVETPDGNMLASAGKEGVIRLWSLPNCKLQGTLESGRVNVMKIAPDGKLLASGGEDHTIKLWSLPEGQLLATLRGHFGEVTSLKITPDGKVLASGGDRDANVRLWSLPEGKLLARLDNRIRDGLDTGLDTHIINALGLTPDGKVLLAQNNTTLKLWSLAKRNLINTYNSTTYMQLTPDGNVVVLRGLFNDYLILRSMLNGSIVVKLKSYQHSAITKVRISPDGKTFACADYEGAITLWSPLSESSGACLSRALFDPAANEPDIKALSYNVYDKVTGSVISQTLPCGSPIPPGATCTCNCVAGTYSPPTSRSYCSCNPICTCVPVAVPRPRR